MHNIHYATMGCQNRGCQMVDCEQKQLYSIFPKEILTADLTTTQRLIYAAIKAYHRPGFLTIPSIGRIAADLGVNRRTVERSIQALEKAGVLEKTHRRRADGGITSNSYVLFDAPIRQNDASPIRQNDASPCDTGDGGYATPVSHGRREFKNNNIFNIYKNAHARNADSDVPANAGTQTDLEDFVQSNQDVLLLRALKKLGKGTEWVQLLRSNNQYYLRPVSQMAFHYITEDDFENFRLSVAEKAGNCHGLKWGQYLERETVIYE